MKVQGERLDLEYLHRWTGEMDLRDLLEKALTQAGLPPGRTD